MIIVVCFRPEYRKITHNTICIAIFVCNTIISRYNCCLENNYFLPLLKEILKIIDGQQSYFKPIVLCLWCLRKWLVMFVVLPLYGMVARRNWHTAFFLSDFRNPNDFQTANLNAAGAFRISVSTDTTPFSLTTTLSVAMFAKGIRYVVAKISLTRE